MYNPTNLGEEAGKANKSGKRCSMVMEKRYPPASTRSSLKIPELGLLITITARPANKAERNKSMDWKSI